MQLTPRYDGPSVLRIEVPLGDPSVPLLRQRRRLCETLGVLEEAQWSAPSRCELWSIRDVVCHLITTNQFFAASIAAGLAGSPSRYLEHFDPVSGPADRVEQMRALSSVDVLSQYEDTVESLARVLHGISAEEWSLPAETPAGHVELRAVALHALWDAWTHERDIVIPLGLKQDLVPDEIRGCLLYAASIGPVLLATCGSTRTGTLAVNAEAANTSFVIEAGPTVVARDRRGGEAVDVEFQGTAVDLIEGLTLRVPLDNEIPADKRWLLSGLSRAFDLTD